MDYNDGDNDNEDYVEEYGIEDELNSDDDIDDLDDDFEEKVIVKKDNEEDLEEEDDDEEGEEEIDTKHYVEKEYKTKYDFMNTRDGIVNNNDCYANKFINALVPCKL